MDFILTALPRSGTTWASVWLGDGNALCIHDPLARMTPADLAKLNPKRRWGISCTGIWLFPEFLKAQTCPIVLIDKNIDAIQNSLTAVGFSHIPREQITRYDLLPYQRFNSIEMFNDEDVAQDIWEALRPDAPFDRDRWLQLRQMHIEPDFSQLNIDMRQVARLRKELTEAEHAS
jgi:hypothetical protein